MLGHINTNRFELISRYHVPHSVTEAQTDQQESYFTQRHGRIPLLACRNLLCTWQYSNKRIIYENQQYHILLNTYTLGYYNLQHKVRYHSYLTLYNLIATGRNVVWSHSVLPFTTRRLPWGSTVIYLCMEWSWSFTTLTMRDLHFVMYTLLGCSIDSCTDTSVILHTLS